MKTAADYIAEAKLRLGDGRMSDRELGERLGGLSQQFISSAKSGKMTDPLAIKIADVLGIEAGAVLMVARLEREKDPQVREHLERWADTVGKALARLPQKTLSILAMLGVAAGLAWSPQPANAAVGGVGRY